MDLRRRIARLERAVEGRFATLELEDGRRVRCTEGRLVDALHDVLQAWREGRGPQHPLLPAILQARPGREPLADLVRALVESKAAAGGEGAASHAIR